MQQNRVMQRLAGYLIEGVIDGIISEKRGFLMFKAYYPESTLDEFKTMGIEHMPVASEA